MRNPEWLLLTEGPMDNLVVSISIAWKQKQRKRKTTKRVLHSLKQPRFKLSFRPLETEAQACPSPKCGGAMILGIVFRRVKTRLEAIRGYCEPWPHGPQCQHTSLVDYYRCIRVSIPWIPVGSRAESRKTSRSEVGTGSHGNNLRVGRKN